MSAKAHKICRDPEDTESSEEDLTEASGRNGSPDSFAVNETLLSRRSQLDSRLSNTSSWGGEDSDSDSDGWLSYQKDVSLGVSVKYISVSPEIHRADVDSDGESEKSSVSKSYCDSTNSTPLKHGSLSSIFLTPEKYRRETSKEPENENSIADDKTFDEISPRKVKGHVRNLSLSPKREEIYALVTKETKSNKTVVPVTPTPIVENNVKNIMNVDQNTRVTRNETFTKIDPETIHYENSALQINNNVRKISNVDQNTRVTRNQTFTKTETPEVTNESAELQINPNIRKIAPKKPKPILKQSSLASNADSSPRLSRKFNSVSPKRKKNKTLALSLDGNLEKGVSEISQRNEDDEGIISDDGSKASDSQRQGRTPTRRNTYLKRDNRPKSEAFLDNLVKEEKSEDLYKSNVSLNSVSPSVQSFRSEGNDLRIAENGVTEESRDRVVNLEQKRPNFAFIRGSDPRVATCRGKLQNKRSKLNQEINKELRLRAGAENLFKATTNRKLKETVALELSFVNSNLQLLKEQLAELNSSVELYQGDSPEPVMPMIPLGLKETKEIDFREPFKDFILEHYSEDGTNYEEAIAEFMDLRQAMRTPHRDASGVALLFQYYNQLYFVERRFFPPDRSLGIYFEWYDSLTGVPSCQRTVAFEKACVLFNIAALYTQLGAKQDRLTAKGLDAAVDNFLRAAGTFTYVHENFTNAPSMDLAPHMLDMLVQLMLAQARECLFEKLELQSRDKRDVDVSLDLAQEAAQVSEVYCTVQTLISVSAVRDYVPYSWLSLVQVKREHYAALAHHHSAAGLLAAQLDSLSSRTKQALQLLHRDMGRSPDATEPRDDHERKLLGRAHLRGALMLHEEAERLLRMCRELRNKHQLALVLARSRDATAAMYNGHTEQIDDFSEILDPPHIHASTKFQLSLTPPDFAQLRVEDLFKGLGPVAIFSAKHHWTAPRCVQLHRGDGEVGFGFSVRGDSPVIIAGVDHGSLAHFGGMKEGDFIVSIGDKDVKWALHEEVVRLIKDAGDSLSLKLVTPMDRNYLKQPSSSSQSSTHSKSSSSSQPSPSNTTSSHKRLTWNPFRRQRERETSFNLILR